MATLRNIAITFLCIQSLDHVYIKLSHSDNSKAYIEDDNTLLHKPVIPTVIAQLPRAHMACLRKRKPKMTKTDSLEIRVSTTILN